MANSLEYLKKELKRWPGVEHRVEHSGRHPRLWLEYQGERKFVPFSSTKVGRYGLMQKVTQLRRTLREIGVNNG